MAGRFLVLLACVGAALIVALPAGANSKPTTGESLGLGPLGPTTFAANTPFHVESGFACDFGDGSCMRNEIGGGELLLYVDGALAASTVDVDQSETGITKLWLSNFAGGLGAGLHTFDRVWLQFGVVVRTASKTIDFG